MGPASSSGHGWQLTCLVCVACIRTGARRFLASGKEKVLDRYYTAELARDECEMHHNRLPCQPSEHSQPGRQSSSRMLLGCHPSQLHTQLL